MFFSSLSQRLWASPDIVETPLRVDPRWVVSSTCPVTNLHMSLADTGGSPPSGALADTGCPGSIPPLDDQGAQSSSGVVRRPLFARDGSPRSQPAPPAGPPPRRPPPGMAEALGVKLPGISAQSADAGPPPGALKSANVTSSSNDTSNGQSSADNKQDKQFGKRIDSMGRHAVQMPTALAALPETEDTHGGGHGFDGYKGMNLASPVVTEGQNRAEPRLSAEIALAARKAKRVAEVRNIAQEVARVPEDKANTGTDEKERGEIERWVLGVASYSSLSPAPQMPYTIHK